MEDVENPEDMTSLSVTRATRARIKEYTKTSKKSYDVIINKALDKLTPEDVV